MTSKKTKEECEICGEAFNKSNRKKIVCPFDSCKKYSCRVCFNHYLKDCGISPTCMWCRKDFSLEIVYENCTQKFYNEYMDHRTNVLIDRAKSELPLLQERVDGIIRKKRYDKLLKSYNEKFIDISDRILKIKCKLDVLYLVYGLTKVSPFMKLINRFVPNAWEYWFDGHRCKLCDGGIKHERTKACSNCNLQTCESCFRMCLLANDIKCISCDAIMFDKKEDVKHVSTISFYNRFMRKKKDTDELKKNTERIKKYVKKRLNINNIYSAYCLELYKAKFGIEPDDAHMHAPVIEEKKKEPEVKFIKKCPNENCRGFLSSAWKCSLCDTYYCNDCHKPKNGRNDDEHVCDEKEKATIEMLKKESKPCPKCGMPIERISGCAQVWTPCCKIAFNWNTGKIDPGRIHSPEYYAYLQRTNGEVPRERGDIPCGGIIYFDELRNINRLLSLPDRDNLYKNYQIMTHINEIELNSLPHNLGQQDNTDLGVSYLLNEITEEKWKSTLKARVKKEEKNNNIYHILYMFVQVMNDLFRNMIEDKNTTIFFDNSKKLIEYTNEQLEKINKRYKSKDKKYFIKA